MTHTRRDFAKMALGAAAAYNFVSGEAFAAEEIPTTFNGVRMGSCLYCYRDIPRGDDTNVYVLAMLKEAAQSGAGLVEINAPYLEPKNDLPFTGIPRIQDAVPPLRPGQNPPKWMSMSKGEIQKQREDLRNWRLNTPMSYFNGIRDEAISLGLTPYSFVNTFSVDMTDAEIESQFRQTAALGCSAISTNQTKTEMAPRLLPFAEKFKIYVGWHNHTQVYNPNEIASPAVFERIFALSPYMKANLDIGHYTAGNNDALEFVKEHADRISHFHMKDRKKNEGPGTPFGEGDAPLKEILLYVRDNKLEIPCIVEYEYPSPTHESGLVETQKCVRWMKNIVGA